MNEESINYIWGIEFETLYQVNSGPTSFYISTLKRMKVKDMSPLEKLGWFHSKEEAISDAVNSLYEKIQDIKKDKEGLDDTIRNIQILIDELKNS